MRPFRRALCLPLLALALLAVPGQAQAAANHPFLSAINGGYEDACGVAFGPGGLYVSDYYHDAIVGSPGIANEDPGDGPCKLAFDSEGNLYVNNYHRDVVKYTEPFGAPTVIDPELPTTEQPTGLTVDPATGNLYVAHRTYVAEYEAPVQEGDPPVKTIGLGSLEEAYGVTVSDFPATAGYVYVPDAKDNTVKVFNPAGTLVEEMDGAATPQGAFHYLVDSEVAIDNSPTSPSYGHLYVLDTIGHGKSEHPEAVLDEFNAAGAYRGQITGFTSAQPSGIALQEGTHNVYVTSGNSEGSAVFVYGPTAPAHTLKVSKTGAGGGAVSSSPAGIQCGSACAAEFNEGQTVTLFAAPDAHSALSGWTVSGAEPCPGAGSCTVLLSANREVSASFEEPTQQTLTVSATGAGEGTVRSDPAGISCPSSCSEHFNQGRLVTLTETPAPHSRFAGWSGPNCDESTTSTCKVEISGAKAISARFEPIPQLSLSVSKTGAGQGTVSSDPTGISCPGTCSASFDQGSTIYLLAAPAPGSGFGGFSGGGCSGTLTICVLTIGSPQTVLAEFTGTALGPSTPAAASAAAVLRVSAATTRGRLATVNLVVPEPGTLIAAGPDLQPQTITLEARSSTLRLHLNRRASRLLHRRRRLRAQLTLGFLSADGDAAATRTVALRFRSAGPPNFYRKGR